MSQEMPTATDKPLWDVWLSTQWMPAVAISDEFGLFDALEAAPATTGELADRLSLGRHGIEALLPMLAALGFLVPHLGRYRLTDTARTYLLKRSPFYWGGILAGYRQGAAADLVRRALKPPSGVSERGLPIDSWSSGQLAPERARFIAAYMHAQSLPAALGLARSVDFAGVARLLDVGGGSGCFAIALAERWPALRATVMELPAMCDLVPDYAAAAGVAGRIDTVSVDMFREPWPTGYDALFFSNIFHDWNVETNALLAAKAHAALPPGGRILLHEVLLDDAHGGPVLAASFSMLMLGTEGRQYSFPELKAILEGAGFTDIAAQPVYGTYSLVFGAEEGRLKHPLPVPPRVAGEGTLLRRIIPSPACGGGSGRGCRRRLPCLPGHRMDIVERHHRRFRPIGQRAADILVGAGGIVRVEHRLRQSLGIGLMIGPAGLVIRLQKRL